MTVVVGKALLLTNRYSMTKVLVVLSDEEGVRLGLVHGGDLHLRLTTYGLRLTTYGLRLTAYGLRLTAHGLRLTAYGLRLTTYDLRLTAYDLRPCDLATLRPYVLPQPYVAGEGWSWRTSDVGGGALEEQEDERRGSEVGGGGGGVEWE